MTEELYKTVNELEHTG